jgi:hypothetical protein
MTDWRLASSSRSGIIPVHPVRLPCLWRPDRGCPWGSSLQKIPHPRLRLLHIARRADHPCGLGGDPTGRYHHREVENEDLPRRCFTPQSHSQSGREACQVRTPCSSAKSGRDCRSRSPCSSITRRLRQAASRRRLNRNSRFGERCFPPTPHIPFMRQRRNRRR